MAGAMLVKATETTFLVKFLIMYERDFIPKVAVFLAQLSELCRRLSQSRPAPVLAAAVCAGADS